MCRGYCENGLLLFFFFLFLHKHIIVAIFIIFWFAFLSKLENHLGFNSRLKPKILTVIYNSLLSRNETERFRMNLLNISSRIVTAMLLVPFKSWVWRLFELLVIMSFNVTARIPPSFCCFYLHVRLFQIHNKIICGRRRWLVSGPHQETLSISGSGILMVYGHNEKCNRTKCHRTKCQKTKSYRTKCHSTKRHLDKI